MSTITSSLLSQIAGSASTANQFVSDLNQLVTDVQSGNLPAAQQDWVTLSEDAENGATSSTATTSESGIGTSTLSDIAASSTGSSSFANELNLLGTDLENGDLSSAQSDLTPLNSIAQSAVTSASASSTSSTGSANSKEIAELITAVVDALQAGDDSAAGSAMSELASVSPNSKGASVLQQASESLGSSSSPGSSSSLSSLLQSLNSGSSDSPSSILSVLA